MGNFTFSVSGNEHPYTLAITSLETGYDDFPTNLNLPEGSVQLSYNSTLFAYANGSYNNNITGTNIPDLSAYVYPAALWYFANSAIKCSNSTQTADYVNENT